MEEQWENLIRSGNLDAVRKFAESNNFHFNDEYPFRMALMNDNVEMVKLFIQLGANVHIHDNRLLVIPASKGNLEMVKLLVQSGIDPCANFGQALKTAAYHGKLDVVKFLIQSTKPNENEIGIIDDALFFALSNNYHEIVKFLVQSGATIDMLPEDLRTRYSKLYNYKTTIRKTEFSCLIQHTIIEPNREYYQCTNKLEHVYLKEAMDSWGNFNCLMCGVPVDEVVFVNSEPKGVYVNK